MSNNLCTGAFAASYTAPHNNCMPSDRDISEILKKMMDVVPGKQAGLAKRLGKKFDQSQVSRWLNGSIPKVPAYERIIELATQLGVLSDMRSEDVSAMMEKPPRKMVKIKGYVGAGGVGHFYNVEPSDLGDAEANDTATDQTVALEIIGSSLGKFFDRWLVFYDDVRSPITDDLIGQLCVVGLSDDRVLIKKVFRGTKRGLFNLASNADAEEPIVNVQIEWAALVTDLRQRR